MTPNGTHQTSLELALQKGRGVMRHIINAIFSIFPNSLSSYTCDFVVKVTMTALFILSGLGFVVLADIKKQRRWSKLMLHSKLMRTGTLVSGGDPADR